MSATATSQQPCELHKEYPLNEFIRGSAPSKGALIKITSPTGIARYGVYANISALAHFVQSVNSIYFLRGLQLPQYFSELMLYRYHFSPTCLLADPGPNATSETEYSTAYKIEVLAKDYFEYANTVEAALSNSLTPKAIYFVQQYLS